MFNDFTGLKRCSQTSNIVMKTVSHVDQREGQSTGLELESRGNTPEASTHDHNVDISRGDLAAHTASGGQMCWLTVGTIVFRNNDPFNARKSSTAACVEDTS